MLFQPRLQVGELYSPWLLQSPAGEPADPVVVNAEGFRDGPMLADPLQNPLTGQFNALFYAHGVDTIVITCHYNSTSQGD